MGLGEQDIAAMMTALANREDQDERAQQFALWPVNAAAVRAFCACATQWRSISLGLAGSRFLGLDYGACKVILDAEGSNLDADGWRRLRVIEGAAAEALNGADA